MRSKSSIVILMFTTMRLWAGEVDTVLNLTVELPGPARQLLEAPSGQFFAVLDGVNGGLAKISDSKTEMLHRGNVASAVFSLAGHLFFTTQEIDDNRVWKISADAIEANVATIQPTDVTNAFGASPTGNCAVARSGAGDIWVEGVPKLLRANGEFASLPTIGDAPKIVPHSRDLHGNSWSLVSTGQKSQLYVHAANAPTEWKEVFLPDGDLWSSVITDINGFVWIGGPNGLRRLNPLDSDKGWIELPPTLSLPTGSVSALARSPNGKALVCFSSGEVIEIDYSEKSRKAELTHLTHELLSTAAELMYSDSQGRVWLAIGSDLYLKEAVSGAWQRYWELLNPLPGGNHDIFSVELNGRLYTAGGVTAGWGYPAEEHWFDELWAYDAKTQVWEVVGKLQDELCYNGITTLNGEVWVVGGADNVDGERVSTGAVQIFDPHLNSWRQGATLNEARMEPVVVASAGRVYAIGGAIDNSTATSSVESIGIGDQKWRAEEPLPRPMRQFAGAVLQDVIYCISKEAGYSYDVKKRAWDEIPPLWNMPQAAQVAAHDGKIWVLGGVHTKRTFCYDPQSGQWKPGPELPTEQSWGSASDLNGRLIIAGGAHWSEFHHRFIFDDAVYAYKEGSFK